MHNYSIQNFWRSRLPVTPLPSPSMVQGWSIVSKGLATFQEAPLTLSDELSSAGDPLTSPLLLVSAPGAVGKSTLAQQIAFVTGAVYVDLAKSDPVGGNFVSGGLLKSGLYAAWQAQTTALLIDGLDEARLRVTQEAFEAFLADVAQLSKTRALPTVLFGRTGAIQDAWLYLDIAANDTVLAVLEIGYYGSDAALEFTEALIRTLSPGNPHASVQRQAAQLLLARLREQTAVDGDRFAGYAPVLQAVAESVAREDNPSTLISQIEKGDQPVTLQAVVESIMERERGKLKRLPFEDAAIAAKLYLPGEQLDRLVARTYQLPSPGLPASMKPADAQIYSSALDTWVGEHPFLKGGSEASSAVFDAVITNRALKNASSAEAAVHRELRRGAAANPFLSEFYWPSNTSSDRLYLAPEHIGIVYASLRSRLSLGDTASLAVEGPEDAEEEEGLRADVEITVARRGSEQPRLLNFASEQTGVLRLGGYVEDVELVVPHMRVEIGPGSEALLVAPASVQCERLAITADKLVVEAPAAMNGSAVYLDAAVFEGAQITSLPVLHGNVSLTVVWPGARAHPWTSFSRDPTPIADPRLDEALRRFRRFVTAFRSHSKGNLARYQHKIEHARMTKGTGRAVLDLLVREEILSLSGPMYYLDPDKLGSVAGATYADCMSRQFNGQTIAFVSRAL